ncbi:MAG TPA: DoxX family membrane protein, partial [Prolixibacteraceae bacterium]|nr:DoxX family membrane protein [Prolixibacteraceae bacterium]
MNCNTQNWKSILITILRAAIGWHFLYEGISKLAATGWTSYGYLSNTTGFLSGFYHALASNPAIISVVDFLNIWGLTAIGLALFLGVFVRYASIAGVLLLVLYYFAYPPFGSSLLKATEGQFLFVDRNFLEALTLLVLLFLKE